MSFEGSPKPPESDRYTMAIIDLDSTTLDIKGRKYLKVPDWSSAATLRDINFAYLEKLEPIDLIWFIENSLAILKRKTVKIELPNK